MDTFKSEKEYLAHYNIRDYELPLVSVDMAIFTVLEQELCVLAVKRGEYPKKGKWALPGGFIDLLADRTIEITARRKLREKTGIDAAHLEQVMTVGNKRRDPRGWSVTIVYLALVSPDKLVRSNTESNDEICWVPVDSIPQKLNLAFDHHELLNHCIERLRSKGTYTWLPASLMPEAFTLTELQQTFEIIIGKKMDAKSFRRRILKAGLVEDTGTSKISGRRHAKLFRVSAAGSAHVFKRTIAGQQA